MILPGGWSFVFPWALAPLALLPALWFLLRLSPLHPRRVVLPSLFLLRDLAPARPPAARAPWWLVLLRALIVLCFILAFAQPVREDGRGMPGGAGPVLIAVDTGWASAAGWTARREKLDTLLRKLEREGRSAALLATARRPDDAPLRVAGPMSAQAARAAAADFEPRPWPRDAAGATQAANEAAAHTAFTHAIFLSDGVDSPGAGPMQDKLSSLAGGLTVVRDGNVNAPLILKSGEASRFSFNALRLPGEAISARLIGYDDKGAVVDGRDVTFLPGQSSANLDWTPLPEVLNRIDRVELRAKEGGGSEPSASSVFLSGGRWRPRPVGILGDPARAQDGGLLDEAYTLRRALEDGGLPAVGSVSGLLEKPLSLIVWPDGATVTPEDRTALEAWVKAGGVLVRFAGPALAAQAQDALLPVVLRAGARALDGAMTWEKPLKIGEAAEEGPLRGLTPPADVRVMRQILAQPTPETLSRTWMRLEDGTPFITGASMGAGTIVLVHTSAGPAWSDFCHSGLYVEVLRRLAALASGVAVAQAKETLPPLTLLDGRGRLGGSFGAARGLASAAPFIPGPRTPPGLYGATGALRVANLGPALEPPVPLDAPAGAIEDSYAPSPARDLRPGLASAGVVLLMLDTLAVLWFSGALWRRRLAVLALAAFLLPAPLARAEDPWQASAVSLGYISTGDADTDRVSRAGLEAVAEALKIRTTVKVRTVAELDPADADLAFYPVIYWPMTAGQRPLSAAAARALQEYMAGGGLLILDTRDGAAAGEGGDALRDLSASLRVPALKPVESDHILFRSFYLLREAPACRRPGGRLWAEKEPSRALDAVTSIVILGGDCAAAWAGEGMEGRPREMALRLGVNFVMAALTGNYKADQIHVPRILERLGR